MCQKWDVTSTSIILRLLLIVGLIVSPLYPRAFDASAQAMAMSAVQLSPDRMASPDEPSLLAGADHAASPCHDGKMDGEPACPCMAACMSLNVQCLPPMASTVARVVVVGQRFAIASEAQLASLVAPPPARPPRA
jgi:hypothetical protein